MNRYPQTLRRFGLVMLLFALMSASFVAGSLTSNHAAQASDMTQPEEFKVFWEAWSFVSEYFVDRDKVDATAMTYGAIEGMLAALEDEGHTTFLSPEAVEMHRSSLEGAFEGIGAYVAMEGNRITIVAPIDGSPAEAAGILAGDVILAVDGRSTEGMSLNEAISLIRGPANTRVILTVLHQGEDDPVEIEIVRQRIEVDSVRWAVVPESSIGYIEITQFAAETGRELEAALRELLRHRLDDGSTVDGLILDLRNNPGGFLREAIRVGSQFLPVGDTILLERDADGNVTTYASQGRGLARNIPILVLINQGTASAGEITAGAIKENGRGELLGQTTFGTGTVLNQFNLSDGSAILLGVTNWLTPKGNLIKGQGVEPDYVVEQGPAVPRVNARALRGSTLDEIMTSEDLQIREALLTLGIMWEAPLDEDTLEADALEEEALSEDEDADEADDESP